MTTENKQKLSNKIFSKILFSLFLIFLALYVSQASGYYEYKLRNKVQLTNEEIRRFEQDVKDGKEINLEEYITDPVKNYQNKISGTALNISETISKYVKKSIEKVFTELGNAISEES